MTKIVDILALPFLATCAVSCFVFIWIAWIGDKNKRSLKANEDGGYEDVDTNP